MIKLLEYNVLDTRTGIVERVERQEDARDFIDVYPSDRTSQAIGTEFPEERYIVDFVAGRVREKKQEEM